MKILVLILSFLFCLKPVVGQDSTFLSLERVLNKVETDYPSILQYQYEILSIRSKAEGATAWMPPTFSMGLMRFPYNMGMITEKDNPMNQAGISFSAEQMIPNTNKLNARKDYLNSLAEIQSNKTEWTKNELRREAKILYYLRFINESKKNVLEENKEILDLLIMSSEEKFSNNQSQLQSIFKAKARLAEVENMLLMSEAAIEECNIGLNILMTRDVNTPFQIDTLVEPADYSTHLSDTSAISGRNDILSMEHYIQSMKLEQKMMALESRPDFGVRIEHMQMFGMPNQWSVMGMMTIPIAPWASKMYTSDVKSMDYRIQSMEQEKGNMVLMAQRMQAERLSMLKFESEQYKNYINKIIPQYESNLKVNLLAFENNKGDLFVILDAWEMVLMKKLEAYDKLFNMLKIEAEYEFEKEIK